MILPNSKQIHLHGEPFLVIELVKAAIAECHDVLEQLFHIRQLAQFILERDDASWLAMNLKVSDSGPHAAIRALVNPIWPSRLSFRLGDYTGACNGKHICFPLVALPDFRSSSAPFRVA